MDRPGGHSAKNARQAGSSTTHGTSEGRSPMVRTTNPDCLALGCDWAWGAEPCICGQPHLFRICARCLVSDDPVCDADLNTPDQDADDGDGWVVCVTCSCVPCACRTGGPAFPDLDDNEVWPEVAA